MISARSLHGLRLIFRARAAGWAQCWAEIYGGGAGGFAVHHPERVGSVSLLTDRGIGQEWPSFLLFIITGNGQWTDRALDPPVVWAVEAASATSTAQILQGFFIIPSNEHSSKTFHRCSFTPGSDVGKRLRKSGARGQAVKLPCLTPQGVRAERVDETARRKRRGPPAGSGSAGALFLDVECSELNLS